MKPLVLMLCNVAVVGVALVSYDVMRAPPAPPPEGPPAADTAGLDALSERVDALERRVRSLSGDRGLAGRVAELEGALEQREDAAPPAAATAVRDSGSLAEASAAAPDSVAELLTDGEDLGPEEVERMAKLIEKVEEKRRDERAARVVDRLLERLDLDLTEKQREQLSVALSDLQGRAREQFHSGRVAGLSREEIGANVETLRDEFRTEIETFVGATDADAIASSVLQGPPGGGRGGPGGGRGGGFGGNR